MYHNVINFCNSHCTMLSFNYQIGTCIHNFWIEKRYAFNVWERFKEKRTHQKFGYFVCPGNKNNFATIKLVVYEL